mmetsp:Transcript_22268/g.34119  ORF Transcript_22268/g.34119 Transcript_22268/m.34119 type:complete len:532 (+) Transcript_22268:205-1800(+)
MLSSSNGSGSGNISKIKGMEHCLNLLRRICILDPNSSSSGDTAATNKKKHDGVVQQQQQQKQQQQRTTNNTSAGAFLFGAAAAHHHHHHGSAAAAAAMADDIMDGIGMEDADMDCEDEDEEVDDENGQDIEDGNGHEEDEEDDEDEDEDDEDEIMEEVDDEDHHPAAVHEESTMHIGMDEDEDDDEDDDDEDDEDYCNPDAHAHGGVAGEEDEDEEEPINFLHVQEEQQQHDDVDDDSNQDTIRSNGSMNDEDHHEEEEEEEEQQTQQEDVDVDVLNNVTLPSSTSTATTTTATTTTLLLLALQILHLFNQERNDIRIGKRTRIPQGIEFATTNLSQNPPHNLAAPRHGQFARQHNHIRRSKRTNGAANRRSKLEREVRLLFGSSIVIGNQSTVTTDALPLDLMRKTNDGRLCHSGVRHQGRLDLCGADAMTTDVEHIIHTACNPNVSIGIAFAAIPRDIIALVAVEVGGHVSCVITEAGTRHTRPRLSYGQQPAALHVFDNVTAVCIQYHRVNPRQWQGTATRLHGRAIR